MAVITCVSLHKIHEFIALYPGLEIDKTSTVVHCCLLISLAFMNVSVITTLFYLISHGQEVFKVPFVYYLFVS